MPWRFVIDGRAAGPLRQTKTQALSDAVREGYGTWVDEASAKLDDQAGVEEVITDARTIFVFGSNEAGRHGAGSALAAHRDHGAIRGVAVGLTGDAYAIPTKDKDLRTLSLITIRGYVERFLEFARAHPDWTFNLVAVGTGLAGYRADQIAPFFRDAPPNVVKPREFIL